MAEPRGGGRRAPALALPIDPLLPRVLDELSRGSSLVLEATPGAGKTTRVPRSLLEASWRGDREILVLEPRRLAAKMAARRVADELGEDVGQTVGYHFRFESVGSAQTRIRFLTEGMFVRKLLSDPELRNVAAVVVDEFHERHLQGDVALGYLKRLQSTSRPELRIVVMSATIDTAGIAAYLGGSERTAAPVLRSEGRVHDVSVDYLSFKDMYLDRQIAGAVKHALEKDYPGDMLVFLPGVAEIRRAAQALEPIAEREDIIVVQLYGDLTRDEQDRALRPADRRKIILSTNIAETSLTIEGVRIVIDSGLARQASHSWWSGLPALHTKPISRASAIQRMGRAGRTAPGHCIRLYGKQEFETRPPYDIAEALRADLSQTVLELRTLGVSDVNTFPWFEAPKASSLEAAVVLLKRLNALDAGGGLTPLGRRMASVPAHPRLARLVLEGERLGAFGEACTLAALLSEGQLESIDLMAGLERARPTGPAARVREQLLRHGSDKKGASSGDLRRAVLAAYPDRVAKRRLLASGVTRNSTGQKIELVLSGGGSALLEESAAAAQSEYFVATDIEERKGGVVVRALCAIEPDWLLDLGVSERLDVRWDAARQRVEAVNLMVYDNLVLDQSQAALEGEAAVRAAAVLAQAAAQAGLGEFCDTEQLAALVERVRFVRRELPDPNLPEWSLDSAQKLLEAAAVGCTSFKDLREANLPAQLVAQLSPEQRQKVDRFAPEHVTLPGGRRVRVHYNEGKSPWIESRLQDFFGMATGPAVLGGRTPLTLHLLAPNMRAVQVTADLSGFWSRVYPDLRRELGRRYPRHSWPENPLTAQPPPPRK